MVANYMYTTFFRKIKIEFNNKGQSATEFLLILPILIWAIIIILQLFYIIYTSLVNQGALRFEFFRATNNTRGYAAPITAGGETYIPIIPELDSFSENYRALRGSDGSVVYQNNGLLGKVYYQVEEPLGSFPPLRDLKGAILYKIKVKNKLGIYEFY